jgi:DNA-binding NtrC family response regulator
VRAVLARALAAIPAGELTARDLPIGAPSRMPLDEVERRHIAMVLEAEGWHQGRAADILGISPKTLYRKIREYGMQRPSAGGGA